MPKKLPAEAKTEALKLYLKGDKTAQEIATAVATELKVTIKPVTIYSWIKQYNWKDRLAEARTTAIAEVTESESARFARLQKEHLDTYEAVRHKAGHELDGLLFDRAFDAVKALDIGIQGERKVMEGMINLQFIQDVLNVLVEEIDDEQIINNVASKLRLLVTSRD
jgi:transposase-like protein